MQEMTENQTLMKIVKARGWQSASRTALDVIEPIAPLISQLLWVFQPISSIIGARDAVQELAETLDSPDGVAHLRDQLDNK